MSLPATSIINPAINVLESLNGKGITLLVVTHDHELGERAQRQLKMRDGCIVSNQLNTTGHASP